MPPQSKGMEDVVDTALSRNEKVWLPYDRLPKNEKYTLSEKVDFSIPLSQLSQFEKFSELNESEGLMGQPLSSLIISLVGELLNRYSQSDCLYLPMSYKEIKGADSVWYHSGINIPQLKQVSLKQQIQRTLDTQTMMNASPVESKNGEQLPFENSGFRIAIEGAEEKEIFNGESSEAHLNKLLPKLALITDIYLLIKVNRESLTFSFYYKPEYFDRKTVKMMSQHLNNLLVLGELDKQLNNLPMLDEKELRWLKKVGLGDSFLEDDLTIAEQFESFATLQPNALAVQYENVMLTYEQLNRASNQLARHIIESCKSQTEKNLKDRTTPLRVVVLIKPSTNIEVALLAILKAGATYIPIDPGFPLERINIILEDVQPDFFVTQSDLLELLNFRTKNIFNFDTDDQKLTSYSQLNLKRSIDSQTTASIFYTSGTTGKPKGVMASYANIKHYINVARRKYQFCQSDKIPVIARFTFSISLFELLLPICSGGSCLILHRDKILDLEAMVRTLSEVTFAHIGPSLLKAIVNQIDSMTKRTFLNIRHISSGGDMIPPELLTDLQRIFFSAEIYVIYGCSEISCMGVTNYIAIGEKISKTYVGTPFENVTVCLLDERLNRVPKGCIGNVCFSGDGLVKGYLNLPELTEEKFFSYENRRYYNTGDRGRLNDKGELELLGRKDFQVQIHGIRIELGEIEYHLRKCDKVQDAIVSQIVSSRGENILVSYIVPILGESISPPAIRSYLIKRLPEYMVPTLFMPLERLPLNHNLKVDRNALPEFVAFSSDQYEKPLGDVETRLASIWEETLNQPRNHSKIGRQSDIFQLGGDSLQLISIRSKIGKTFSVNIAASLFYQYTSLESLAALIKKEQRNCHSNLSIEEYFSQSKTLSDKQSRVMSFAQNRLWYLEQLNPNSPLYNVPLAIKFDGTLNEDRLIQFVNYFVQNNESLRTSFRQEQTGAIPFVHDHLNAHAEDHIDGHIECLNFYDKTEKELKDYLRSESLKPIDMGKAPLFRFKLLRTSKQSTVLFFVVHHIIFDAWSFELFLLDMANYFRLDELQRNELLASVEPSRKKQLQYSDYSYWQKNWVKSKFVKLQLDRWLSELSGELPILEFPQQKKRPLEQSYNGTTETLFLDRTLSKKIIEHCKSLNVTPFMYFMTIYCVGLYRYCGQTEIVLGTPIANRNQRGSENIVGFFVNTLPIRVKIEEHFSLLDLLAVIKNKTLFAIDNQDVPFENLVAKINPKRDPSRTPIFQTIFNFLNVDKKIALNQELSLTTLLCEEVVSKTDISLNVHHAEDEFYLAFEYCIDLFEQKFIKKFTQSISLLIESSLQDMSRPIDSFEILPRAVRDSMLQSQVGSLVTISEDDCLLNRFIKNCKTLPNKVAVITDEKKYTFNEINQMAIHLAGILRAKGVKPGDIVGMLLSRCETLPVSMLAIFYLGASYLPLDPEYPEERIVYILNNAKVNVLLQDGTSPSFLDGDSLVTIDVKKALGETLTDSNLNPPLTKDQLAYLIYTSGSTGNPKGVMITQRNLTNFLIAMIEEPGFNNTDTILTVTTIAFDIAVLEILLPLFVGATSIIVNRLRSYDPSEISQLLVEHDVSVMQATPATWQMLNSSGWRGKKNLKALIGGEALPKLLVENLYPKVDQIWNMYGPTETTVWSSCYRLKSASDSPKIGRPIVNTQTFVVNNMLKLVPNGVVGELCIGGEGVTLGYLGEKNMTDDKFVDSPFDKLTSDIPLANKIYRTGDYVKYDTDGNLEYIGRMDFQVKVRGYRIELGEIETALDQFPSVLQSVVSVREDKLNDQRIVAYIKLSLEIGLSSDLELGALREHLSNRLPSYMIPHRYVVLDQFPMTPNGKVDRKSLPAPDKLINVQTEDKLATDSQTEKYLSQLWSELIGEKEISANSLFFELGGHSLLALQVIGIIKRKFSFEVTPLMMIKNNLRQIAARIDGIELTEKDNTTRPRHELLHPFYFDKNNSLFAIHHEPLNTRESNGAVLICGPIFAEVVNASRALKRLASKLTERGYHVLRFDYSGMGDSSGEDGSSGSEQWLVDITEALTALKQLSGDVIPSVVGLRIGASLLAQLSKQKFDKLIFWEPVISGRQYFKELERKYQLTVDEVNLIRENPTQIEKEQIVGFRMPTEVKQSIRELEITNEIQHLDFNHFAIVSASLEKEKSQFNKLFDESSNMTLHDAWEEGPLLESYINIDAYLPRVSLNVIVSIIDGKATSGENL